MKYQCIGCSKMIVPVSGKRKRKYHDYACYAKASASIWGIDKAQAKAIASRVMEVNKALKQVGAEMRQAKNVQ